MAYTKYSLTPANNNAAPPDGAPEGMLPSAVNDTMRDMMAQIRDCGDGIRGGTYTMTAPVITGGSITNVALSGNTLTNPVITGGSINNTPIGASTASTGAFSTLSASSTVSGSGFSSYLASPPAIGGTAPAAVSSTNLAYTGTLTGGTGVVNLGSGQFYKDASGLVGIGTSSPSQILDISKSQNSPLQVRVDNQNTGTSAFSNYLLTNSTSSGGGGLILFGANFPASALYRSGGMYLYTQASNTGGITINTESAQPIYFGTSNTERMRIDSSGNVGIGTSTPSSYGKLCSVGTNTSSALLAVRDEGTSTGNLFIVSTNSIGTIARINSYGIGVGGAVPSSGMGLSFPATQSVSSDANTLDDYEEGTWTPGISFGSGSIGITYSSRNGRYTKIGRMITVGCTIVLSAKGSSTGGVQVTGLPFPSYTGSGAPHYVGVVVGESNVLAFPQGTYGLAWSDSTIYVRFNSTTGFSNVDSANFTNNSSIYVSVTYEIFS